jgi:hypothetical protein
MKKILFFSLLALVVGFSSYTSIKGNKKPQILKGQQVQVHGGKAWTWIQLNKQGNPERIGVSLTDEALKTVPTATHGSAHGHTEDNHWVIKFPAKANLTPFNHLGMHWNPSGHEPETIYTVPHFDFHFYSSKPEEVLEIGTYEKDSVRFKNVPSTDYFPAQYMNPGAPSAVPQMGSHWMDVTSGEFNGKPFTETFIYGSFDGKVTFQEPMITLDFLKKTNNYVRDIPQPAKVQKTTWYPTKMKIVKHDGVTDIILDQFVFRKQS